MMMIADKSEQEKLELDIKSKGKEIDEDIQKLFELNQNDQNFITRLKELKDILVVYRQTRDEQIALIYKGKIDQARQLSTTLQNDRFEKIRSIAVNLSNEAIDRSQASIIQAEQSTNQTVILFLIVGVIVLFLSIIIVLFLNRIIVKPLKEISVLAEQIASGDLSVKIFSSEQRDEVGVLKTSFSNMIQSLQDMAGVANQIAEGNLTSEIKPKSEKDVLGNSFSAMVKNLRILTNEIREGMNVLSSSASEILASTTQVAAGASETATAITETTTTVEEVKQTAQVSSQKAKYVYESSQKANQVAQSGKKSIEESIEKMNNIKEQVEYIAESIVRLSEQSQAIGEIIASVNDLAEQSNLLAVNAAIEAAKAGEQGRGFSVVAQEVKSLSEQSKQATAQVRTILNDIQRAVSSAVMATEQGSKAVDAGVKQSLEANESIRIIVDSITESSQASTQIAATSQQQLVGMDQVALAMENIKQASTQNVTSSKQSEIAAQNLHELGQKLKQLVERYKL
jgi:methyl-accepting chemotaxis protein